MKLFQPKPTVLVLNQDYWVNTPYKSNILNDLPDIFQAGLDLVDIVLWQRGTPTIVDVENGVFNYSHIDLYIKDVVCNMKHAKSVKVVKQEVAYGCTFVDFPQKTLQKLYDNNKKSFVDNRHFVDPSIYLERNEETMKVIRGMKRQYSMKTGQ